MTKRMGTLALLFACLAVLAANAAPAGAAFGIKPLSFAAQLRDQGGGDFTRAAGHPDSATFSFGMNTESAGEVEGFPLGEKPSGLLRDAVTDLPAGFIANPQAAEQCEPADPQANLFDRRDCPTGSQVGVVNATIRFGLGPVTLKTPLFNLDAGEDEAALFGFQIGGVPLTIVPEVRADRGYAITSISQVNSSLQLYSVEATLWGIPADPSHDSERVVPGSGEGQFGFASSAARKPFLINPSDCSAGPLSTTLKVDSYEHPGQFQAETTTMSPGMTGCDTLSFQPKIDVTPDTTQANSPAGYTVDLTIPQTDSLQASATPNLRDAVIRFPEGTTVSPSSADGQVGCSDAQIGLGSDSAPTCPQASKIGNLTLTTPVLADDLTGDVYLAEQHADQLLRVYLVIEGHGVRIKLAGDVDPDPVTGQLTASFEDNPQLPFSELSLHLKGGPRAPLVNPSACGPATTTAKLTAWGMSEPATPSSTFQVTGPCGTGGFAPKLQAGTTNPIGGSFSPFVLRVTRADGEQNLARLAATLPAGVLAKLAGVPLCGEAQAGSGDCPAASQVGKVVGGIGSGTNPLYVPQPGKTPTAIYLAGPYKGAPYSLVAKVPAQAGPFDLGTVTVRNAIEVDPVRAQATVTSDPLPQILQGIPISYRDVRVDVDRPQFTLNPTSCDPMAVQSTLTSAQGKTANPSSRFQVADCERLAFKPKLAIELSGKTNRTGFPKLKATLTMPKGGANIARAAVTLPKTEFLEQSHIRTICTRVQYAAKACPKASVYGYAKAWSPLLDKPLQGPVYLRSSSNPLPDLVADLNGQIDIDLTGRIDTKDARIRNTFDLVPDAPVSKFVLTMQGAKKGLLVNNTELCRAKPKADVKFDGQNGKVADSQPRVKVACGGKGKKK